MGGWDEFPEEEERGGGCSNMINEHDIFGREITCSIQ